MPPRILDPDEPEQIVSLGWVLIDWIETYLCHGPGDLLGEPIVLDDERSAFIVESYELDPVTGRRVVRHAFLSRSKGWAKSEVAGMLSCCEGLGPVRFDGWDANGDPVGRPVRDPFIRCLATEEGQTGNTYGNVTVMLQHLEDEGAGEFPRIDIGNDPATSTRVFFEGGGEIRPSTSGDASKDGGLESFTVADETHLYITRILRSMYSTVARNGTKRKIAEPWRLDTSTMYQPGQGSVAEDTHMYWRQIQAGLVKNRGLLFNHRQGPMPKNWDDDEEMVRCLKVAYGAAAPWTDFEAKLADIRDPRTTRSATCRYYLNRPEKGEESWCDPELLDRLVRPGPPPPDGAAVALGFDGSESDDNTALLGINMATARLFVVDIWGRGPGDAEGWQVPRPKVKAVVADTFRRYQVAKMLCDPPYWRTEIAEWQAAYGEKVVEEYSTKQWSKMAQAVERLDSAMRAEPPAVGFDGNPVLRQHFLNAHKEPVNRTRPQAGFVLVKERHGSPDKIDGAVAAVLANEARDQAVAAGWKPPAKAFAFVLK